MSNKKRFQENLYARVRIRPFIFYADLNKHIDDEWIIDEIDDRSFKIQNPVNGYWVCIGHDARREWTDDFSKQDGLTRGIILLKAQITLSHTPEGKVSQVEPMTDSMLSEAMKRTADQR